MEEEVRAALIAAGFTDDQIQLEATQRGNVGGFVISPQFAGQPQIERQRELWETLRRRLTPDQLHHIVSILTMTPDEIEDDVRAG